MMKRIFFTAILVFGLGFSVFAQTENPACPKIKVSGGGQVRSGEPLSFTVSTQNIPGDSKIEYDWTISAGTITSGQGTPSITIDTTGLDGQNVTATVEIKGISQSCQNIFSEVGIVSAHIHPIRFDEFGKLRDNDVVARIDALYIFLISKPEAIAYIINYGTDMEIAAREKQIRKAFAFRKYDEKRISIIKGGANPNGGIRTKIWAAPSDVNAPQP